MTTMAALKGTFQAKRRAIRYNSTKAKEQAADEIWRRSYARLVTPSRIEVNDTNLLIDQNTYVRCLVVGLPKRMEKGIPGICLVKQLRGLRSFPLKAVRMLSHSLIQIPADNARESLQQASFAVNMNKKHNEMVNHGSPDLELMCKGEDIVSNYVKSILNLRGLSTALLFISVDIILNFLQLNLHESTPAAQLNST